MTPNRIKKEIQKLAAGMQEAESSAHDHALHAALSKLHGNHGTSKLIRHLAHVIDEEGEGTEYDLAQSPTDTVKHLKAIVPEAQSDDLLKQSQAASIERFRRANPKNEVKYNRPAGAGMPIRSSTHIEH